ncbi:hypothetical protein [Wolinella succinogenes]|uniref:hypothetical protein n=1 Tax=Wolinella succinogenes TaxID=844 RepID=UPI002FC7749D
MAKTMIVNDFQDGTRYTTYLPATATKALAFASGVMDSRVTAYSLSSESGSDAPVPCKMATCHIKQVVDGQTASATYVRFLVKPTTKETDIQTALAGQTVEGVRADEVGVSFRAVTF